MESKEELLNAFLGPTAESTHIDDMLRFVKYAVACIEENTLIDIDKMRASGYLTKEKIHEYDLAFAWIKLTYEYTSNKVADEMVRFHREHDQKLNYQKKTKTINE